MVKVVIADDSTQIRKRIIKLLSSVPDVEIVGEAIDGVETAVLVRRIKPDVVILDLQMPKVSGLEILPRLKEIVPPPVVVVLTNFSTHPLKAICSMEGADFFFDKSTEFEKAVSVIREISAERTRAIA